MKKIGRNDLCPCGSGRKYKVCCLSKDSAQAANLLSSKASIPERLKTAIDAHQNGRLSQAETIYQEILEIEANHADALHLLGVIHYQRGSLALAVDLIKKAIAAKPSSPVYFSNLGNALKNMGRLEEAEASYRKALELKPDYAEAHCNLGNTLRDMKRLKEAETSFRRALKIKPDFIEAHNNLGTALWDMGQIKEAETSYRKALQIRPDYAEAHNNLGTALRDMNRLEEAEACFRQALQLKPDYAEAHSNLGNTLRDAGRMTEAESSYRQALQIKPNFAGAHRNRGLALKDLGRYKEAEVCFRRALELKPDDAVTYSDLGNTLRDMDRFAEAEASFRRALEIKPDYALACFNLENIFKDTGRLDEAEAIYHRGLEIQPDHTEAYSNLLFAMNYNVRHKPRHLVEIARGFGQMLNRKIGKCFSDWQYLPRPDRLLVGFVSGDLRNHPVGFFLESILSNIDHSRMKLIAYPTDHRTDEFTALLRPCFADWKPLLGLNDEAAARLIHADGVHVLLDLSGHTARNRLPVFGWKPAPVQASWLGYFATTGVAQMDYILVDEIGTPRGQEFQFTEKVWRLPDTRLCFTPPNETTPVSSLPALDADGHNLTFGCFQTLSKVNDGVMALWGRVFAALPEARLRWQCRQFGDSRALEQTQARLAGHGIAPSRVSLLGKVSRGAYLAAHNEVDAILDTFPYPGGTTTCEALWMGVPTLTLAGDTLIARQGASLMTAAGLPGWVATSEDDFVARAIAFTGNREALSRLARLRAELRGIVAASPLFDAPRFARHFEAALWEMWKRWENPPSEST